jgi:hypothetical protein
MLPVRTGRRTHAPRARPLRESPTQPASIPCLSAFIRLPVLPHLSDNPNRTCTNMIAPASRRRLTFLPPTSCTLLLLTSLWFCAFGPVPAGVG